MDKHTALPNRTPLGSRGSEAAPNIYSCLSPLLCGKSGRAFSHVQVLCANMNQTFCIRSGSLSKADDTRLLSFFDSQLQWLAVVGSSDQWGNMLSSDNLASRKKYHEIIKRSEATAQESWTLRSVKEYFAEINIDVTESSDGPQELSRSVRNSMLQLPVGAMILEGRYAEYDYAHGILPEQDEEDPFIFVSSLISDCRASPKNKGVGHMLLNQATKSSAWPEYA